MRLQIGAAHTVGVDRQERWTIWALNQGRGRAGVRYPGSTHRETLTPRLDQILGLTGSGHLPAGALRRLDNFPAGTDRFGLAHQLQRAGDLASTICDAARRTISGILGLRRALCRDNSRRMLSRSIMVPPCFGPAYLGGPEMPERTAGVTTCVTRLAATTSAWRRPSPPPPPSATARSAD